MYIHTATYISTVDMNYNCKARISCWSQIKNG